MRRNLKHRAKKLGVILLTASLVMSSVQTNGLLVYAQEDEIQVQAEEEETEIGTDEVEEDAEATETPDTTEAVTETSEEEEESLQTEEETQTQTEETEEETESETETEEETETETLTEIEEPLAALATLSEDASVNEDGSGYLIDCGYAKLTDQTAIFFEEASKEHTYINAVADRYYEEGDTWGVLADSFDGAKGYTSGIGSEYATGYYGDKNGKNVTYIVTLDKGNYEFTSGHYEWWNTSTRITEVTVSYTLEDGSSYEKSLGTVTSTSKGDTGTVTGEFEVEEDDTLVTIEFSKASGSVEAGTVAYFEIEEKESEKEQEQDTGLLAQYTFQDLSGSISSGTTVKDQTGNENDATIYGSGATVTRQALDLPGGSSSSSAAYVDIPTQMYEEHEELTISLWLQNDTGKGNYAGMFLGTGKNSSGYPTYYWLLNPCNPSGYFKSVWTDGAKPGGPWGAETAVSTTSTDGGWGLYTTVITENSITGYYNGKQVSKADKSLLLSEFEGDLYCYIGKSSYADKFYDGQVKDVRIYGSALSSEEIADMYQEAFPETATYDGKAKSVDVSAYEEVSIEEGDDISGVVTITMEDGSEVDGVITWDEDISSLKAGDYTIHGVIDYFAYPLIEERPDPYIYFDEESGYYYFTSSYPAYGSMSKGYDRINLRKAKTIDELTDVEDITIWKAHTSGEQMYHIWAPELHKIGDDWYLYYAASTSSNGWGIRAFVLKCEGDKDITDADNWTELGHFLDENGNELTNMCLDMTYFEQNGKSYVIWADKNLSENVSYLKIGEIDKDNPCQLKNAAKTLSKPEYSWERVNEKVNEGPAVLQKNGKIYVTYSAAATGDEYCVGLLTADADADLMDMESWSKSSVPVLSSDDTPGEYGPGHNSFTVDANGNVLMVYHARDEECHNDQCGYASVDALYDPCRNAIVKYVRYDAEGEPIFSSSAANELGELREVTMTLHVGNLTPEERVKADLEAIMIPNSDDIRGNITLGTVGSVYGSKITWASSKENVITVSGEVTRKKSDTTLTLTATVTDKKDSTVSLSKDFTVTVRQAVGELTYEAYLFAYFTGEGTENGEQIYFATSEDGLNWTAMNSGSPVLTSTLGEQGLRDPFIIRSPEGDKFYLIATDLKIYGGNGWTAAQQNGSKSIMIWESTDLVNWSDQRMVEVATEGAGCTWAPEAFYDAENGEYIVFWSSKIPSSQKVENNDYTHRVYYATTRDFYTFSEPEVWIELHNPEGNAISVIDATIIQVGDTYYRFTKNEATQAHKEGMPSTGKYIMLETSNSLMGEWTEIDAPNVNVLTGREGATCFKFNQEDKWCLLLDNHGNGGYHPLTTTDLSSGEFTALSSDEYSFPSTMRHGTVMNLTMEEYERIQEAYNPDYKEYSFVIDGDKANTNEADAFKGIGAVTANNSSRLLVDYKEENPESYWAIMNTLFNKETGAGLSYVKVELGSDANTSSGTEPASMRSETEDADATRGAGWMFAADAKKINPDIQIDALRWSEPAWVGGDYEKRYTWYLETMKAVYDEYGLKLDYLSVDQNETASVDTDWIKYFAVKLDAEPSYKDYDFSKIKLVASDEIGSYNLPAAMMEDEELRNAVDAIGIHYTTKSDSNMLTLNEKYGKELFYSEGVSPTTPADESAFYDGSGLTGTNGALDVANRFINSYYNGSMVLYEYQPSVAAYYEGAKYFPKQILTANTPWSGYYKTDIGVWTTAHFMQFIDAGWQYIDGACYGDGTENQTIKPDTSTNNYMTLTDPETGDYTIVATNDSAKVRSYKVKVENLAKAGSKLKLIETIGPDEGEDYDANWFTCKGYVTPKKNADGSYTISFKVQPYSMVTLTTLTDRGPDLDQSGITQCETEDSVLALPYEDDFEYAAYSKNYLENRGNAPRYTTDQGGAFGVVVKNGNHVMEQQITADTKPDDWRYRYTPNPYTILGDDRWSNYTVTVDVKLDNSCTDTTNYAGVGARHITTTNSDSYANAGYQLVIYADGTWALLDINTTVDSGKIENFTLSKWYTLSLTCVDNRIIAYIDGEKVTAYTDDTNVTISGKISFMSGYYKSQYDNLQVTAEEGYAPSASKRLDNFSNELSYIGDYTHTTNAGYSYYGRTISSLEAGGEKTISHTTTTTTSGTKNAFYYYKAGGSSWSYNADNAWSGEAGSYYEITFNGTGIALSAHCNGSNGSATVYLDGEEAGSLDCYSSSSVIQTVYEVTGLTAGTHTIKVVVDEDGKYVSAAPATIYGAADEETALSFDFTGTGFHIIGQGSKGSYDIYIDGEKVDSQEVSSVGIRQCAINMKNLSYEKHTAKIIVTSGTLKVDAVEIMGEILGDPVMEIPDYELEDALFKLQSAVKTYTLTKEEKEAYSKSSLEKFEEAYGYAKKVANGWGDQTVERITSYYNKLVTRYKGLEEKGTPVTYTSFTGTNGDTWYDTDGTEIQAHGGQVLPVTQSDGSVIYYWYGEDKTDGYRTVDGGVRVYSSTDLYNWKAEGIALRDLTDKYDFEEDYFANLYGDYTEEQKEAVLLAINDTTSVIERPKVIYNEKTKQYVMWFHADGPTETSTSNYAAASAGVAVSDSPTGPFRFIGRYRLNYINGAYDSDKGMARDMNLFVDDDATAYIIYSSEQNQTMFISQLNADYTALAYDADEAAEKYDETGEMLGFNRIACYIGAAREAPAMFKYNGTYYLMTSGCTGWGANPAKYAICTGTSPLDNWTDMGNPCVTDTNVCKYTASLTFGTQSTCIIPVNPEKGEYIYMGDRWNNSSPSGNELIEPKYVWLPVQFTTSGEMVINPKNDWTLDDLGVIQYAVTLETKMPATVERGSLAGLPKEVTFTYGEESLTSSVKWKVENGDLTKTGSVLTLKGTLLDFQNGKTSVTAECIVVSEDLVYLVDCGMTEASGKTSEAYENVKGQVTLKNEVADAAYTEEAGWGYLANSIDGQKGYSADFGTMNETGYYGTNGSNSVGSKNVTYYVTLDAGEYDLVSGHCEWWNTSARTTEATVSYTKADGTVYSETLYAVSFSGTQYEKAQAYGSFSVEEDNTLVTITFGKSYASAVGGVVSFFAVSHAYVAPQEPEKPAEEPKEEETDNTTTDSSSSDSEENDDTVISTTPTLLEGRTQDQIVINENLVPLAGAITDALKPYTVDVTLQAENKLLQLSLLEKYYANPLLPSNMLINIYTGPNVGMTFLPNNMTQTSQTEMKLGYTKQELPKVNDTDVIFFKAEAPKAYDFDFMMHFHVGEQYIGKTAKLFKRATIEAVPELVTQMEVNEIGNVAFITGDITDVIILVEE